MTTLTLTPDPTFGRMRVIVQDALGGTLYRDGEAVRGATAVFGDRIVDDYEVPINQAVTYVLEDGSATGELTVTSGGGYISHPTDPTLLRRVSVESDDEWQWTAPGTAHPILGSEWPVVTHTRRTVHEGTLLLITPYAEQEAIKDILVTGSPLLLRVPPDCPVDSMWFWPERVTRSKIGTPDNFTGLRWEMQYQRVQKPGGEVTQDPSNSWSAVTVTHPTWTDLQASHATWLDVLVEAHPHA